MYCIIIQYLCVLLSKYHSQLISVTLCSNTFFFSLVMEGKRSTVLHAKSLQLCLTVYDTLDYSLPGSSVYGIL